MGPPDFERISMKVKILLTALILSVCVAQLKGAEVSDGKMQRVSFHGKEAQFDLRSGQRVKIVEDDIGNIEIELLSITDDSVKIVFVSTRYKSEEKINIGQEFIFLTGGLEQTGALKLLGLEGTTAKFKIEFGSAPPAPEIASDMPIDIIYLK